METGFGFIPALFYDLRILFPEGFRVNLEIGLRVLHLVAGILWIGLLYFFNLVQIPFFREMEAPIRPRVLQGITLRALQWFRWASVVTVVAGLVYWSLIIAADSRNAVVLGMPGASMGTAMSSFFLIWTVAWGLQAILILPGRGFFNLGPVVTVLVTGFVVAAGWAFLRLNTHGWESNRMLAIGIGGGLGWLMLLNVWGILWRAQKQIIRGTLAGKPPKDEAILARQSYLTARVSFWLSFPMLFFMAAASHYPFLMSMAQ